MAGFCAVLGLNAGTTWANTYCVTTAAQLQAALTDAGSGGMSNDQDNTIRIAGGTFTTSGAPFFFGTLSGFALTLEGGWNGACSSQDLTPGTSVLDGGNLTQVLSIQSNGDITIRHLTIQHAYFVGSAGGGAKISMTGATGSAVAMFDGNVVRDNTNTYATGGLLIYGVGVVHIENSLFVGNTSPSAAAFSTSMSANSTIYVTNNTVSGNVSTNPTSYSMVIGGGDPTTLGYVSNTISYGNTATYDYYLSGFETVLFTNNDYGSISGSAPKPGSTGNLIGVNPRFVGADDFHLQSTSPLLRAGTLTPAGGLSSTDLEGNPRSLDGLVDIGAYENIDVIFANGFDPG